MTRSKDITPDCESYFSMENGNDSHTLIVQTLPPPGRETRTCGKAVQATSSPRSSIPSLSVFERRQRLNQLPVRAGRRAPRAMERGGGKRKEALTPQNDKAALGGAGSAIGYCCVGPALPLHCTPRPQSLSSASIFVRWGRITSKLAIIIIGCVTVIAERRRRRLGPFAPPHSPASPSNVELISSTNSQKQKSQKCVGRCQ